MRDQTTERLEAPAARDDTMVKSYTYLRTAMVGLIVALGVAVFYQTWQQDTFLSSVSAYYYTPAQAMFVGGLIGLGACMIALRGTTTVEEVFLDIGGMFAILVAIVPTSRGGDHRSAVEACAQSDSPRLAELDCPTVQGLVDQTRANVENNTVTVLIVGLLGLVAAVLFALRDARRKSRPVEAAFWWGLSAAAGIVAAVFGALTWSLDWFVANTHLIAAAGLFVCVFVVAVTNALRRDREQQDSAGGRAAEQSDAVVSGQPSRRGANGTAQAAADGVKAASQVMVRKPADRYVIVAWALAGAGIGGPILLWLGFFNAFWLEIVVAVLFATFWMVQTIEQEDR